MPATQEQIAKIMSSSDFDIADKCVVKWQFHLYGDFYTALFDAIKRADDNNLDKLQLGFPSEVIGFKRWTYGGLGRRLREAGLDV